MLARTKDDIAPPIFRDYEDVLPGDNPAAAIQTFLAGENTTLNGLAVYQAGPLHADHIALIAPDNVPVLLNEKLAAELVSAADAQGLSLNGIKTALENTATLYQDPLFSYFRIVADQTGAPPNLDTLCALTLSHRKPRNCFSVVFDHPKAIRPISFYEGDLKKISQDSRIAARTPVFQEGLDKLQSKEALVEFQRQGAMKIMGVVVAAFAAFMHMDAQDADQEGRFQDLQRANGTSLYVSKSAQLVTDGPLPSRPDTVTTVYNLGAKTEERITRHPIASPWRLWDGAYNVQKQPLPENKLRLARHVYQTALGAGQ
jgi:hypothetical protein